MFKAPIDHHMPFVHCTLEEARSAAEWLSETSARLEAFQAPTPVSYTYGSGRGVRTYASAPMTEFVAGVMRFLNDDHSNPYQYLNVNVCFLNRYLNEKNALGWHADDSPEMDNEAPIYIVSFGATRALSLRPKGTKGPATESVLLTHGSLLVMRPGMQLTWEHKIPKHSAPCGERISLTYRRMKV